MHIISDQSLRRQGYVYEELPNNGGWIGRPETNRPSINWKHIDGPLLYFRNGQLHWLSYRERLRCWLGWDDAASLEKKLRQDLT